MSKLFDALRALSPEDEEEYAQIRRASTPISQNESALNAAVSQQPQQANPGIFAGLRRGITGGEIEGESIPFTLGMIPGALLRQKFGLEPAYFSKVKEAIDLERAKNELDQDSITRALSENPRARLKQRNIGGATIETPETEEEFNEGVRRDVIKAEALESVKPPSQAQETTALYAKRLEQAEKVFEGLKGEFGHLGLGSIISQGKLGPVGIANWMKSAAGQSYEQAQRNFLNAVLRKESGAVISPSEFAEGRAQYFPQAGDKESVILQKEANRKAVIESMKQASGKAYTSIKGTSRVENNSGSISSDLSSRAAAILERRKAKQ